MRLRTVPSFTTVTATMTEAVLHVQSHSEEVSLVMMPTEAKKVSVT